MSKFAMVPRKAAEFHEDFNAITLDLLKKLQQQKNPETKVVSDVADLLFQWSFECKFFDGMTAGRVKQGRRGRMWRIEESERPGQAMDWRSFYFYFVCLI